MEEYSNNQQTVAGSEQNILRKPDNFLLWAILATIFCGCGSIIGLVTGIIAIVYASKVNDLWMSGAQYEALDAAKKAKILTFITIGVGVVIQIVYWIFYSSIIMAAVSESAYGY